MFCKQSPFKGILEFIVVVVVRSNVLKLGKEEAHDRLGQSRVEENLGLIINIHY